MNIMTKEEARKELEFYKNLASNHEEIVKGCNEKIIELEAIINKPDRWQDGLVQPEKEEYFYLINRSDKGLTVSWSSENNRKPEHAFKTQEQAELIKEKALLMQEMHAFAHVKNEGVEPAFATVGDIVSHTGMYISDVNCELSMLRSSGVIKQVEYWEEIKPFRTYNWSWGYIIADAKWKDYK